MRTSVLNIAALDSFLLFGCILFTWAFGETFWMAGTGWALPGGIVLWGLSKIWQVRVFRFSVTETRWGLIGTFAMALLSLGVGFGLWDSSFDGRAYHQEAILRLASDYHPYHAALADGGPMGLWVEHYPKALEIVGAAFYRYTGSVEIAKGFAIWFLLSNLLLLSDSILALFPILAQRRVVRAIAVVAIAANPVVLSQLATYYVDGLMYSLLLGLVLVAKPMLGQAGWKYYPVAFAMIISVMNLKFTSVVYACMVIGALCAYRFWRQRRIWDRFHVFMAIAVAVGIAWVGFNPYVTNTLGNGHVFYPLYGDGKVDIMVGNSPVGFPELGRFGKFAAAFWGETENVVLGGDGAGVIHNKFPGLVYPKELTALFAPDCRIGGFGPLTSLYLLMSLIFLYGWLRNWRWDAMHGLWLLALVSSLMNPEFWWARYAPQLWLVPLFPVCAAEPRQRLMVVLRNVVLTVLILNVLLVGFFGLGGATAKSWWMRHQIGMLQGVSAERAMVFIDLLTADRSKLANVPYQFVAPGALDSLNGRCADFMEYSKVCFRDSVLAQDFERQAKLTDFLKSRIK